MEELTEPLPNHAVGSARSFPEGTAAARGWQNCRHCLTLHRTASPNCTLCKRPLFIRRPHSLQKTLALLLTAVVLYVPANTLPIMITAEFGVAKSSTIVQGVLLLWQHGSYPTALIILVASVLVPIGKMVALAWLCWSVMRRSSQNKAQRERVYRVTEYVGRWSMVDVFVVAILVALVQVTGLLTIAPGPAALAFCGVVVFTMLAATAFDSRLIWDHE